MSDKTKQTLATWVPIAISLLGLAYAALLLPYRMGAAEADIEKLKNERQSDHDLLQRIDERTSRMEKTLDRLTK